MAHKHILSAGFIVDPPYGVDFLVNFSNSISGRGIDVDHLMQASFFVDPHTKLTFRQIDESDLLYDAVGSGFVDFSGIQLQTARVLQENQANIFHPIPDPLLFYIRKPTNKLVTHKLITSTFQLNVWVSILAALLLCSVLTAFMRRTMPTYRAPRRLLTIQFAINLAIILELFSNLITLHLAVPLLKSSYPFSTNEEFMQFVAQGRCNVYSVYQNATAEMDIKFAHESVQVAFNKAQKTNSMKVSIDRQALMQAVLNEPCAVAVDYHSAFPLFEQSSCAQVQELELVKLIPTSFAYLVKREKESQMFARKLATVLASPVMWGHYDYVAKKYGASLKRSAANCSMLANVADKRVAPLIMHQLVEAFYLVIAGSCIGIFMFLFELTRILTRFHPGSSVPQPKHASHGLEQNVASLEHRAHAAVSDFVSKHFQDAQSCVQYDAATCEDLLDMLLTLMDAMKN